MDYKHNKYDFNFEKSASSCIIKETLRHFELRVYRTKITSTTYRVISAFHPKVHLGRKADQNISHISAPRGINIGL